MLSVFFWRVAMAVSAILLVGASGCGSPATTFYALNPLPPGASPKDTADSRGPGVGVGPAVLPDRLDRPQIVTRVGENMLHLAEFDQWAAPLRDSFPRVLAENLSILIPTDRVSIFPWSPDEPIDFEVRVEVSQFEGSLGGDCSLVARWSIFRRGDRQMTSGISNHTEPAGDTYTTLVAAENRLLAALSRDIATTVKALQQ